MEEIELIEIPSAKHVLPQESNHLQEITFTTITCCICKKSTFFSFHKIIQIINSLYKDTREIKLLKSMYFIF